METLALIDAFVRSAEAKSFSAAARKLGVTPAAVSKNVAKLEASLGVQLFQRTTRSLTLTEAGKRFHAEASPGLATLREAIDGVTEARRAPQGTLRLSVTQAFGREYVVPLLGGFLKEHPLVVADFSFENRPIDLVAEGFDVAIGAGFELPPNTVARELARAHVVAIASKAYVAEHGLPKTPSDLSAREGIVMRSAQTGRVREWPFRTATGERAAFLPKPRIVFDDSEAIARAALLGLGIGFVAMPHAAPHLESGALVRVLPKWHADIGAISIYFASQRHLPAKTRVFVDYVVQQFKRLKLAKRFDAR